MGVLYVKSYLVSRKYISCLVVIISKLGCPHAHTLLRSVAKGGTTMKKFRIPPNINIKINHVADGASINFGPSIHKGHQANAKIDAGEIIIGDEIIFGNQVNIENNNEENNEENNNQENKE